MALTSVEVQTSCNDDASGGPTSTLKWDTLRAVHGGISIDQSPMARCGRPDERYSEDDYADDELNDLGLSYELRSLPAPHRESGLKTSATPAVRGAVSVHHPDPFAVLPVTPQKPRRVYDSDTSTSPSDDTPNLWPSGSAPCSNIVPYPENEREADMTPGDLCSIRTPDLHRVAPAMARDRVQQNQSVHLPAYLRGVGRAFSPSAKYDGLQSSPAKFEVVEEDEDDVDID